MTLHSEILGDVYGKRKVTKGVYYMRLINILLKIKVVEVCPHYKVGSYSKAYRINPQFLGVLITETIESTSIKLPEQKLSKREERHKYDIKRLTFDTQRASEVLEFLHLTKRLKLTTWVNRWAEGEVLVTDDDNGRIYSNITGLNKEFRQCISYQGRDVYSVDLKQAHPYLFIYVLNQKIKQNHKKSIQEYVDANSNSDVSKYITDTCSKKFIDGILENIQEAGKAINRKEVKKGVLAEVLYQPVKKNKHKVAKAFSTIYPTVWKYIQSVKKENHKILARKLMLQESRLMNRAVDELYKKFPDGLFIRLHDAIITTKDAIKETENMIIEIAREMIGWPPVVETTQFNIAKGNIADHELSFPELDAQYGEDLKKDLEDHLNRLKMNVFKKKIDWSEYNNKYDQKYGSITSDYIISQMKQSCFMSIPFKKIDTSLSNK